jgi:hypothetical protein
MSFWLAGAGHGTYIPAIVLFPYTMGIAVALGNIAVPLVVLALAQYPAYAALLGCASSQRRRRAIWVILARLHVAAVLVTLAFAATDDTFWP